MQSWNACLSSKNKIIIKLILTKRVKELKRILQLIYLIIIVR